MAAVLVAVVVPFLGACRVDVAVDVVVDEAGAGTVTVTVTADADVVAAAPLLAEDLRTEDLVAAGWEVDGPSPSADGGLEVILTTDFASPEEANVALAQLSGPGGPFVDPVLSRLVEGRGVTYSLDGSLALPNGLEAFVDAEVVSLVGGVPYAEALADRGLTLEEAVGVSLTVSLPGEVRKTTAVEQDGLLHWTVATDGSAQSLVTSSVDEGPSDSWGLLATGALVAAVAWLVLAGAFVAYVVRARRQRSTRRRTGTPLTRD
ncbi:MAG: hypothetical protein IPM43_08390 [Actinomycetota bacterium]|nr:MAG: hypothetical protein IPM43_08390 [Actinomycetota bacterium]